MSTEEATVKHEEVDAEMEAEESIPPIKNTVYPYLRELVPPTGVTLSGYGHITSPQDYNLVVVRTSLIQIYTVRAPAASDTGKNLASLLTLVYEKKLFGVVQDMGILRHPQRTQTDLIILTFVDAKASVLRYDADTNDLQIVSMHCFERRPSGTETDPKYGCSQFVRGPWVRVENAGKCAAVLVYDRNIGIIAFDYPPPSQPPSSSSPTSSTSGTGREQSLLTSSLGFGDLLTSSSTFLRSSTSGRSTFSNQNAAASSVTAKSHIVNLGSGNVLDFAFGFEYEPILFVLYRREYTWAGRTERAKYTNALKKISFNLQTSKERVMYAIEELPYNCDRIIPLKAPLNGVLVLSANTVLYCAQTVKFCLVLNEYGEYDVADRKWTMEASNERIILDNPKNFAMLADDKVMITNRDGAIFFLTVHHEGQDVRSLSITSFKNETKHTDKKERLRSPATVSVSTLCTIPELNMCYFGSKFSMSSLVKYKEVECTFDSTAKRPLLQGQSSLSLGLPGASMASSSSSSAQREEKTELTEKEMDDVFDSLLDGFDSPDKKEEVCEEPSKKKAKMEMEEEEETQGSDPNAATEGDKGRQDPQPFVLNLVEQIPSVGVIRDFVVSDTLVTSKMRERDVGCGTYDIIACTGRGKYGSSLVALENYVRLNIDVDIMDMKGYPNVHFAQLSAGSVLIVGSGKGHGMVIRINNKLLGNRIDGFLGKETTISVGNVSDDAFVRVHDSGFVVYSSGMKMITSHDATHSKVITGSVYKGKDCGLVTIVHNNGLCKVFSIVPLPESGEKGIEEVFAVGDSKHYGTHSVTWATVFSADDKVFLAVVFKTGCLKVFRIDVKAKSATCVFGCGVAGNAPNVIASADVTVSQDPNDGTIHDAFSDNDDVYNKDDDSNSNNNNGNAEDEKGEKRDKSKNVLVSIREVFFAKFKNSLDLIMVFSNGQAIVYKGRKQPLAATVEEDSNGDDIERMLDDPESLSTITTTSSSKQQETPRDTEFPYVFFKVSSNFFCGSEGLDAAEGVYVPRIILVPGNRPAACISGKRPLLVTEESGYPRVLPLGLPDIGHSMGVAPFKLGGRVGIAVLSMKTHLKVYSIPTVLGPSRGIFGGWVAQRIHLDKPLSGAPNRIVYAGTRKLHVVATAETTTIDGQTMIPKYLQNKMRNEQAAPAGAAAAKEAIRDFSFVTRDGQVPTPQSVLNLVKISGSEGKILSEIRLEPNEVVYSMICFSIESTGKQVVVVGTGILENENAHCVGRLLIYEIEIPPEEDDDSDEMEHGNGGTREEIGGKKRKKEEDEKCILKEVLANKYLGPVTSLHVVEGKLLVASPPIICLYTIESNYTLLPENFQYVYNACTAMGVATFKSLRTVIFLGDSERNVSVLRMASLRRFRPLCKDNRPLCAQAAIVLTDRERESFCYVVADIDGNCHVLSITNKGEEARKLLERPLPPGEPLLYAEEKTFRVVRNARINLQAHVSVFHRLFGYACAFGTMEGGISAIALLPAEDHNRLVTLQDTAARVAPFTAGLNPRQYRAIKTPTVHYAVCGLENFHPVLPKEVTLNNFVDGDLFCTHFLSLPLDVQARAANKENVALADIHKGLQKTEGIFNCFISKKSN